MLFNNFKKISISHLRFEYNFLSTDNFGCISVPWIYPTGSKDTCENISLDRLALVFREYHINWIISIFLIFQF